MSKNVSPEATDNLLPIRVDVALLIYSDTLSPGDISDRLRIEATASAVQGVTIGRRTGTRMVIPKHMWEFSSESHVPIREFDRHLSWLLGRLVAEQDALRAIRDCGSTEIQLIGHVWTAGSGAHVHLKKAALEQLVAMDLELHLEFADYEEGEVT